MHVNRKRDFSKQQYMYLKILLYIEILTSNVKVNLLLVAGQKILTH